MPAKEEEELRRDIFLLLRKSLRPEFLNRIDEIVMFKPLNYEQIREIVKMQLDKIGHMIEDYNMKLLVTEHAIDWLTARGYDPQSGARPVKRLIQKEIVNELSKEIIGGKVSKQDSIVIDVKADRLTFSKGEKQEQDH